MSGMALDGLRVLSLAVNLPGPVAAARLQSMGADIVKVEPPPGDQLALFVPDWYKALTEGQQVLRLDLKAPEDRAHLDELLGESDLLLTATRPNALKRLGLDWERLHQHFPVLCHVAILGYMPPDDERTGHDLSYQAELGLLDPPHMPRALWVDLAGAERAVSAALALLLARARGMDAGYAAVSLFDAAKPAADCLHYGLTRPGGFLGGGMERYRLYPAQQGWIAVAALEQHFWERLLQELELDPLDADHATLEGIFRSNTAQYWHNWASERDLPVVMLN